MCDKHWIINESRPRYDKGGKERKKHAVVIFYSILLSFHILVLRYSEAYTCVILIPSFPAFSSLAGSEQIFLDCLAKLISSLNLQGNKD